MTPPDLDQFVAAQAGVYETALAELRAGRKTSHWMWFVFPQLSGLGHSEMARTYAVGSLDEARAYLAHPVLEPRLIRCIDAVLTLPAEATAVDVFGDLDARKLWSSMTLFLRADPTEPRYQAVLDRWYGGRPDAATDDGLAALTR